MQEMSLWGQVGVGCGKVLGRKKERKSMIEGLKKGMKPTGKKSLHGKFPKSIADFADSVLWQ